MSISYQSCIVRIPHHKVQISHENIESKTELRNACRIIAQSSMDYGFTFPKSNWSASHSWLMFTLYFLHARNWNPQIIIILLQFHFLNYVSFTLEIPVYWLENWLWFLINELDILIHLGKRLMCQWGIVVVDLIHYVHPVFLIDMKFYEYSLYQLFNFY